MINWRMNNKDYPSRKLVDDAKQRARKRGIPFDITFSDVHIPENCPVFGTPLTHNRGGKGGPSDNSPTLDRIIPALGYVKGNVIVISNRANRIKNDATPEELEVVAHFYRNLNHEPLRQASED
jgi:hypothetical protein